MGVLSEGEKPWRSRSVERSEEENYRDEGPFSSTRGFDIRVPLEQAEEPPQRISASPSSSIAPRDQIPRPTPHSEEDLSRAKNPRISVLGRMGPPPSTRGFDRIPAGGAGEDPLQRRDSATSSMTANSSLPPGQPPKLGRQISLGKHGFGIAAPKAATAEIQTEHASSAQAFRKQRRDELETTSKQMKGKNVEHLLRNSSLPSGWFATEDQSNLYYYSNTGQVSWDRPTVPASELSNSSQIPASSPEIVQLSKKHKDMIAAMAATEWPAEWPTTGADEAEKARRPLEQDSARETRNEEEREDDSPVEEKRGDKEAEKPGESKNADRAKEGVFRSTQVSEEQISQKVLP
jgi:hypothetical protein